MATFIDIGGSRFVNADLVLIATPQQDQTTLHLISDVEVTADTFTVPPTFIAADNGRYLNPEQIEYAAPQGAGWLIHLSDGTTVTASTFTP